MHNTNTLQVKYCMHPQPFFQAPRTYPVTTVSLKPTTPNCSDVSSDNSSLLRPKRPNILQQKVLNLAFESNASRTNSAKIWSAKTYSLSIHKPTFSARYWTRFQSIFAEPTKRKPFGRQKPCSFPVFFCFENS